MHSLRNGTYKPASRAPSKAVRKLNAEMSRKASEMARKSDENQRNARLVIRRIREQRAIESLCQ